MTDVMLSPFSPTDVTPSLRRLYCALGLLFICVGAVRIISTYHVFSQTFDEPMHIACGLEWWDRGTYTIESQHPPLARLAAALGPYLAGARSPGLSREEEVEEGNSELYTNNAYWSNLALARIGILPFYLLACVVVWLWTERAFGSRAALLATLFFTFLPPILGHSGLATTDMAVTASLSASLLCLVLWIEDPTPRRSVLLGATLGLAVLSKFSTLVFLPVCVAVLLGARSFMVRHNARLPARGFRRWFSSALACLAIASVVVWAGYRFSLTPLIAADGPDARGDQQHLIHLLGRHPTLLKTAETMARIPFPGMMVVRGVRSVWVHNAEGHSTNFLGSWSRTGWWYFFPVLLVLKTPLAFLILALAGFVLTFRSSRTSSIVLRVAPGLFVLAIIGVSLFARINIGIRHILPVYPLLAIVAACAGEAMLAQRKSVALKVVACGLILWLVTSSALAHPDYLAYFNELIPDRPERITVESDLDWGQDLQRLSDRLRQRSVQQLSLSYFGTANLRKVNLPQFRELPPYENVEGWVAISLHNLELPAGAVIWHAPSGITYYSIPAGLTGSVRAEGGPFSWLKAYSPTERVGRSILLYYIRQPR